jgi:hypothetical protein
MIFGAPVLLSYSPSGQPPHGLIGCLNTGDSGSRQIELDMSKNAMTNFGPTDPNRLSTTSEDLHAAYDNPDDIDTAISSAIKALNQINYLVDSETERPNTQLSRQLRLESP